MGCAAHVIHTVVVKPFRKVGGDVARTVVAQQARLVDDAGLITARRGERHLQCVGDVFGFHGGAQLPGDDVSREVIENGRQIEPAPPDDLEIREVGLPELIDGRGLVPELIGSFNDDERRDR